MSGSAHKFDRHKKRSPAAAAYRNVGRMELNKKKAIAKHAKTLGQKDPNRGTARALKRKDKQKENIDG